MNVYIAVSDNRGQLTMDGSLELFGQLLTTILRAAPDAECEPVRTKTATGSPANAAHVTDARLPERGDE